VKNLKNLRYHRKTYILRSVSLVIALIVTTTFTGLSHAIDIPRQLRTEDLDDVTRVLGFNTGTRFLSNPYPLGGYAGFEVGVTLESINTRDLENLGNRSSTSDDFRFSRISIGKGLFNDLDAFIHFVPYSPSNKISDFGGTFKWMFYEAKYIPITISALVHLNTMNFEDLYISQTGGMDLLVGFNMNEFSFYVGGGEVRTKSLFTDEILDASVPRNPQNTFKQRSRSSHFFTGLHAEYEHFFLAAQVDKYVEEVWSLKLGLRL
jgi:hypothetical protein